MAAFQEDELMCIWVGGFPEFPALGGMAWARGSAKWKIIDAKQGVLSSGELTVEMAQAVSRLPSACGHAEALLNGKDIE